MTMLSDTLRYDFLAHLKLCRTVYALRQPSMLHGRRHISFAEGRRVGSTTLYPTRRFTSLTSLDMAPKVGIIGCGIAGPVLASFLKLKGYEPAVYERYDTPTDTGLSIGFVL